MNKTKSKKSIAVSLLAASALTVGVAAFAVSAGTHVYAADYTQELDGTKIFYTGIKGAQISNSYPEGEDGNVYTTFEIGKDESVAYRQNLAYNWIVGKKGTDGKYDGSGEHSEARFSMEIGFAEANFQRYVVKFQSQQNVLTEEGITENYLVFTPSSTAGKLDLSVVQKLEEDTTLTSVATCDLNSHITISFGEYNDGNYPIFVNGEDTGAAFVNVYKAYSTYVSSGDNAVTPLMFSAEFAKDASADAQAEMILYEINGQSFELKTQAKDADGNPKKDGDKTLYETKVLDNAAPVMCFTSTPSYLEYGKSIGFSYKVIDVLGTSTRATAYYYVLTGEQYAANDFEYDKTDYPDKAEVEEKWTNPFIEVSSGSSIRIIRDDNTFVPSDMLDSGVYGLVKIYYEISDRSGSSSKTDTVFVDWYAKQSALVNVYGENLKNEEDKSSTFIKLIDEKQGLTYAQESNLTATEAAEGEDPVLNAYKASVEKFREAYQLKIDEAIAALEDEDGNKVGKLYAGTDSKFYLPSFQSLKDKDGNAVDFDIASLDDYKNSGDYTYSIYYKAKTSGSATSLASNKLAISLAEADVTYRFTIYVTDSFGNPMRYPTKNDAGEIVWNEISKDEIWNEENAQLLPFFDFEVSYKEATAEEPKDMSIAYVDTSYSGISFKIKGVANTYKTEYNLYVFDRNAMNKELGVNLPYEVFLKNIEKLFNNDLADIAEFTDKNVNTRKYFTTVKPVSNLLETDENYEMCKDLNWNSTSVTFTPRSIDDFYVVRLTLTDNNSKTQLNKYTAVAASVKANPLKGESDWLENNKVSIILLSVAGVCLIAIVVLFVVKPKDKGDIDEVYSEVNDKKSKKKKADKK